MYIRLPLWLLLAPAMASAGSLLEYRDGHCVGVPGEGKNAPLSECGSDRFRVLEKETLTGRTLRGIDLTGASVLRSRLTRDILDHARLGDTDWKFSTLTGVSFFGADLRGSRWAQTHADNCDFSGADARAARWTEITLAGATFRNTRFEAALIERVVFRDADFRGAHLRDVLWLRSRCERCRADATTELPWPKAEAERRGFVFE